MSRDWGIPSLTAFHSLIIKTLMYSPLLGVRRLLQIGSAAGILTIIYRKIKPILLKLVYILVNIKTSCKMKQSLKQFKVSWLKSMNICQIIPGFNVTT